MRSGTAVDLAASRQSSGSGIPDETGGMDGLGGGMPIADSAALMIEFACGTHSQPLLKTSTFGIPTTISQ